MDLAQIFKQNINLDLFKTSLPPGFLKAGTIVFLIFLLILSFAQIRRHFINWSVKGAFFGIFFGFLLALIFEGFLIIGGKTAITELLGWRNAPKPIQTALEAGRARLVDVLGIKSQIPSSFAQENPSLEDAVSIFQSLDPSEAKKLKSLICQP